MEVSSAYEECEDYFYIFEVWKQELETQEWKDTNIMTFYKNKKQKSEQKMKKCPKWGHLVVGHAGKVFAKVLHGMTTKDNSRESHT